MLSPSDSAIIGAASHGHIDTLDKLGLRPEWVQDDSARAVVQACLELSRSGKAVNLLNTMALARNVKRESWQPIIRIWQDGFGDVDATQAVNAARAAHMSWAVGTIMAEADRNLSDKPGDVQSWLPAMTQRLASLSNEAQDYDPRPSAIKRQSIPQVQFESRMPALNEILRGGYRNGMLAIFAGVTKHGKTTLFITVACDVIRQERKVIFINNENTEAKARLRILRGLTGLSEAEIANDSGNTPERTDILRLWEKQIEDCLRIYNHRFYSDHQIRRILAWEKPDVLCLDYLRYLPGMFADKRSHDDYVGDFSDFLLEVANDFEVAVVTGGQIADQASKKFVRFNNTEAPILYGSARVGFAADIYAGIKRHNSKPNTAFLKVWLDRLGNRQDSSHELAFDTERWVFC